MGLLDEIATARSCTVGGEEQQMRFEARELKPYAEPVSARDLKISAVYFAVQFIDSQMLIPEIEALVFIGRNLLPHDVTTFYFQDAASHGQGIRFGSAAATEAVFYAQAENEIKHIFEYERALDVLLECSLRRRRAGVT